MKQLRRAATLPVTFFKRPAEIVAADLVGKVVVSRVDGRITAGRIVETEAYLGYDDPASHGYLHRRNARNEALFGPPGIWYVYLSYGMHWCANLVCQREGLASAVLLRALEPIEGLAVMRRRRGQCLISSSAPAQAACVRRWGSPVSWMVSQWRGGRSRYCGGTACAQGSIAATPRIGITKAADWPLRFHLAGSPWTSRKESAGGLDPPRCHFLQCRTNLDLVPSAARSFPRVAEAQAQARGEGVGRSTQQTAEGHDTRTIAESLGVGAQARSRGYLVLSEGTEVATPEVQPSDQAAEARAADGLHDFVIGGMATGVQNADSDTEVRRGAVP